MAEYYKFALEKYHPRKSLWEVFLENTRGCRNIVVLKGDSKSITIPCEKISFALIDSNHEPEYIENDFYLIWDKLSTKGCIVFDDYDYNLPRLTEKIDELIKKHFLNILKTCRDKKRKQLLYIIKK